jgi:hypothetical protein
MSSAPTTSAMKPVQYRLETLTEVFDLSVGDCILPGAVNVSAGVDGNLGTILVGSAIHHKPIWCLSQFLFDNYVIRCPSRL